jgi:hypothetical protein
MSYCRFLEADAYIYEDSGYGLYCSACLLMPVKTTYNKFLKRDMSINEGFIAGSDYDKMLTHIADHREADHYIPLYVDERLIQDRDNATDK